jgi:hypothetical protein
MEEKSSGVMLDFLKQFEPNHRSLLGKIVSKIRKRDLKANSKLQIEEEPMSDFDY